MSDSSIPQPNYPPPLDRLLRLGEPKGLAFTLDYRTLGLASEHVPELLRMVLDEELHTAPGKSPLVWAPVHAWRALASLKAETAIEPLLNLLQRIDDHDDDWVNSEVPHVLGEIGSAALDPVTVYLADPAHKEWARVAAAEALGKIGEQHVELRAECISRLSAQLEKHADQSETLNAFLVSPLLDLKAREALPAMERAFAAGHVDESVAGDYEDVEIELGVKPQRQHPPKPNDLTELRDKLWPLVAARPVPDAIMDAPIGPVRPPQPYLSPGKTGRNDPCPCGSGKKYKKCCGK